MSTQFNKMDRVEQDAKVLEPFMHIQQTPSKFHRALYRSMNYWLNVPQDKFKVIEEFMQTLHSATLMFDDIQDESTFRYGAPVAHCVFSTALTINAASHALIIAMKNVLALGLEATQIYLEGIIEGHRGQGIDVYWRDNMQCPSEDEYLDMIRQKTSFMFVMAYHLMQIFSENKTDYSKITTLLGMYYQIRDDYCNLLADKHSDNKSYCSDITEGKFSLPVIHAYNHSKYGQKILNILKRRTQDVDIKSYCVSIMETAGSFQYTKEMLIDLEAEIYEEIKRLGGNPKLAAVMDELSDWKQL